MQSYVCPFIVERPNVTKCPGCRYENIFYWLFCGTAQDGGWGLVWPLAALTCLSDFVTPFLPILMFPIAWRCVCTQSFTKCSQILLIVRSKLAGRMPTWWKKDVILSKSEETQGCLVWSPRCSRACPDPPWALFQSTKLRPSWMLHHSVLTWWQHTLGCVLSHASWWFKTGMVTIKFWSESPTFNEWLESSLVHYLANDFLDSPC